MFDRKNPSISTNEVNIDSSETYDLSQQDFMIAFSAEKRNGQILEFDPRYIRWMSKTVVLRDGVKTDTFYPLHRCSDQEVTKFFEADS